MIPRGGTKYIPQHKKEGSSLPILPLKTHLFTSSQAARGNLLGTHHKKARLVSPSLVGPASQGHCIYGP